MLPGFEARELLTSGLDGPWWPFALFARGGLEAANVRRLIQEMNAHPDLAEILPAMLNLVTFVVDSDQAKKLLEDPMFDSILAKIKPLPGSYAWEMQERMKAEALAEGRAEGEARGVSHGETREAVRFARRLLARKFGMPDTALNCRLETLSVEKLEALGAALFDLNTPAELDAWLDAQG